MKALNDWTENPKIAKQVGLPDEDAKPLEKVKDDGMCNIAI